MSLLPVPTAYSTYVVATGADGVSHRVRAKGGKYRIRGVPAGTYTLTFIPDCGERWTLENVVVSDGAVATANIDDPNQCETIIVGKLMIDDDRTELG